MRIVNSYENGQFSMCIAFHSIRFVRIRTFESLTDIGMHETIAQSAN